jgi:hypothetical protein
MGWFRDWLDDVAPAGRPVVLVGFSGGAAFAGGLVLDDPARFAGAAILHGTLPFDARALIEPGRPAHLSFLQRSSLQIGCSDYRVRLPRVVRHVSARRGTKSSYRLRP